MTEDIERVLLTREEIQNKVAEIGYSVQWISWRFPPTAGPRLPAP